ncbi:MAG: 8-oxo-dGTP diphosphatase MutT [Alphaproteobacteria bacterium]|nr:8-oxo-dGTP diphosphatase MutT [Alphaproteobacteria bacterium]
MNISAERPRRRGGRGRNPRANATGSPGFAPLETERLRLRPLRPGDADELHRLVNDWAVTRMLAVVPFPYPRSLADEWITSTEAALADGTGYHLAITGREAEETLVGVVSLKIEAKTRTATLGYWVGQHFWGRGVATEAARRLARWGFANLHLDRLVADVATDNPASAAVLRRIGFRQTGDGRKPFLARATEVDVLQFEATRDDLFGVPDPGLPNRERSGDPLAATVAEGADGAKPILLVAACALIDPDGRVLLARRPEGKTMAGLWEFPGGKLAPGETPERALIRELKEELGIDVASACLAPFAFASHEYERFHLLMPLYLCRRWRGRAQSREGQALAWVRPEKLADYPVPPADKPLIPLLRDLL